MFTNFLKISFRNFRRKKIFSLINILGLSLGLACTFVILFHVLDELSYDNFHKNSESIYKLVKHSTKNDKWVGRVSYPEGKSIENKFADIKNMTVLTRSFSPLFKIEDHFIREDFCVYADTNFLKIFSINLVQGKNQIQLNDPSTAIISEKIAKKYFGTTNAISKLLTIKDEGEIFQLKVAGVFQDLPNNSTLKIEILLPIIQFQGTKFGEKHSNYEAYLHIPKPQKIELVSEQINKLEKARYPNYSNIYHLLPLRDIRLHSSHITYNYGTAKSIDDIYVYCLLALLILFVACANFIILSTANTTQKGKEIGVRKLVGARNLNIKSQIIVESIISTLISLPFSIFFFEFLLPQFNSVTGKELEFSLVENILFVVLTLIICFLISFVSGVFISLRYNKMNTVDTLKNQIFGLKSKLISRRVFIVIQLTITVSLIICSLIVIKQINYLDSKNMGFDKKQLVIFNFPTFDKSKLELFKEQLRKYPNILNFTSGTHMPPSNMTGKTQISLPNNPEEKLVYEFVEVDYDYFQTMDIKIIKGRDYSREYLSDSETSVLVNKEFMDKYETNSDKNESAIYLGDREIIGIIENYHIRGLYEKIPPAAFFLQQDMSFQFAVRISNSDMQETIKYIDQKWREFNTEELFSYNFADEKFDRLYKSEQNFVKIIGSFSILAIIISCMGIFGLMILTIEQRTKEIGVRKVLGASVSRIINLLTKEYLFYISISLLIASPFAFYFMNNWLDNFAYNISISAFEFIIAAIIIFLLTFSSIGFLAIRAASLNPVDSLRSE